MKRYGLKDLLDEAESRCLTELQERDSDAEISKSWRRSSELVR